MEGMAGDPVHYSLPLGEVKIDMNALIGSEINMEYNGEIHCIRCGRPTRRSFAQGYCYPCFTTAPETEDCVLKPELCRAHEGVARDMDYARGHCLIEHVVYLSLTSGLKVGVTRHTQVPTRWIDQGAMRAVELARTPDRHTAGEIEVALKAHVNDKTNWRQMLTGPGPKDISLRREKDRVSALVPDVLKKFLVEDFILHEISYPVEAYPRKVSSLSFDKDPQVRGILEGIKGQYLLLDGNRVINMRKFGGYRIRFSS